MLVVKARCILWCDRQTVAKHDSSISVHCEASDLKKKKKSNCRERTVIALITLVFPCPIAQNDHIISDRVDRGLINTSDSTKTLLAAEIPCCSKLTLQP